MFGQFAHKLVEILVVAAAGRGLRGGLRLDVPPDDAADLVGQRADHRAQDLRRIDVARAGQALGADFGERAGDAGPFGFAEPQAGLFLDA